MRTTPHPRPTTMMRKPLLCFVWTLAACLTSISAYSSQNVPQSISSKYLTGNTDQDTMMYIYNSLASSGTQACNAILQTTLSDEKEHDVCLEGYHLEAMKQVWKIHCSQMTQHLDATSSLVCPTLSKSGADLGEAQIVEAQKKLRECMSSADQTLEGIINNTKERESAISNIGSAMVCYQQALMELFDLQTEEFLVNAKSSVNKKVWDKMNKELMSKGGDMGAFIHFMGVDAFRNGWGKGQPGFLWNLVFSKDLKKFEKAFGEPMEILEKAQPFLDLAYTPSLESPTPWSKVLEVTVDDKPVAATNIEDEPTEVLGENFAEEASETSVFRIRKRDRIRNLFKRIIGRKLPTQAV